LSDVSKEAQEKINQLQMIEQSMSTFVMQKQQLQQNLIEVESALTELEEAKECYKIVGNVMVKADAARLKEELKEKQETFSTRIDTIDKQQQKLKEKASKTQKEVMEELKAKNG